MVKFYCFLAILICFSGFPSLSQAKIINVPTDIDSIQGAINLSVDGDTVLVQPGIYVENIDFNAKSIVVGSLLLTTGDTSYVARTVIDGNKSGSVVSFSPGSDSTTVLSGFTLMNGFGPGYNGGGIQIELSHPVVTNMRIINNTGGNGGGIKLESSNASFEYIIVKSNSTKEGSGTSGGGIYIVNGGRPTLTNVIIENNFAYRNGGGICIKQNCHPILKTCQLNKNTAKNSGGGIFIESFSNSDISKCIIKDNVAEYNGGGIFCENSNPRFKDLIIENNSAEDAGGGIFFDYNIHQFGPELGRLKIIRNKAKQGGGIYIKNCTKPMFSEDKCNIYLNFSQEIGNDLFAQNTPTIVINLDTFSVAEPKDIHAYPIKGFSLDINHGMIPQIDSDLYVSPDGNDHHDGLSKSTPLKTLTMAFTKILTDSTKQRKIFLDDGVYDATILSNPFVPAYYSYIKVDVDWQAQMNLIGSNIIVNTPWWNTYFAWISYFVIIVGLFYSLRKYDLKRQQLRHELEMEHLNAEKMAEIDRMKSRFFANISHEFRTPLTLIKGPVQQIMSGQFKGNLKEQCRMILRNSDRLLNLINQILDLSKLESGQLKLQTSQTDIIKFLKRLVLSFSSLADRKKITLEFKADNNSLIGYIDRDKIEKVINNLLSNAFKFTPEQCKISVVLKAVIPAKAGIQRSNLTKKNWIAHQVRDDIHPKFRIPNSQFQYPTSNFIQITISNTGPGIPPDQLDKIFDRFYQADTTYKKDGEGSGIGLALTKELVELHRGKIDVECCKGGSRTKPTSGESYVTTFTINIPIGKDHLFEDEIVEEIPLNVSDLKSHIPYPTSHISHPCSNIEKEEPSHEHRVPSILLVEDNPDVTRYICSFLDYRYRIITAENGKEGWKKTLNKYPDLIISDLMMPEMDGFELCQKLKSDQRTSHIPVILLTARADLDSRLEGLEFGADDYISKPFEANELKVRAANLIEQRQKLREKFSRLIEIKPGEITASSMDEQFLERLIAVSEKHLSESGYSTENLAREIGLSRSQLNRKLKALTDLSTHGFILNIRLKRAAKLLKKRVGTITEIAYTVGFNNPANFSKAFKSQYGQSPRDFISNQK